MIYLFCYKGIPADASENTMRNYLQSLIDIGSVSVKRGKDCAGFKWNVKWANGGDKKSLSVSIFFSKNFILEKSLILK